MLVVALTGGLTVTDIFEVGVEQCHSEFEELMIPDRFHCHIQLNIYMFAVSASSNGKSPKELRDDAERVMRGPMPWVRILRMLAFEHVSSDKT